MNKKISLIFLGLSCVYWAALAGTTVVQHGRGTVSRMGTATTTTTTTIPPQDLLTNGDFSSADGWVNDAPDNITITAGAGGYARIEDRPEWPLEPSLHQVDLKVTNGWTYDAVFTLYDSIAPDTGLFTELGIEDPWRMGTSPIVHGEGTHTQRLTCGSANQTFYLVWYWDGGPTGPSVSNIHLYVVSAP